MNKTYRITGILPVLLLIALVSVSCGSGKSSTRDIISLNGTWNIAEGPMDSMPNEFPEEVTVPGLTDMASPSFNDVGMKSDQRDAFWYQKSFTIDTAVPETALLKIHKAKYGIKVFLNGSEVGESQSCFTPNVFDISKFLAGNGEINSLIIRVGAQPDAIDTNMPSGHDFEKLTYIPGIYDDVELILTGSAHIIRAQIAPNPASGAIRIVTIVENSSVTSETSDVILEYTVRESSTGKTVAHVNGSSKTISAGGTQTFDETISFNDCHVWSPEDPFLYELEISTGSDTYNDWFGMRTFRFDADTGYAVLNGRQYFMRGTNVCIFRFFEDPDRGVKPWDEKWVRNLHRKFKSMGWNSIRYCIGFPPEMWYRIADEEGLLIQDEYPIWGVPEMLDSKILTSEYTQWMRTRWNHPCVVIWDAQNETKTHETGIAIGNVRYLDLSNRPWDNGYSEPQKETDSNETHPYLFIRYREHKPAPDGPLAEFLTEVQIPQNGPTAMNLSKQNFDDYPTIINEYAWLWLNRDGTTTTLTDEVYKNMLGPDSTTEQRLDVYARYLAALSEYWRSHRLCAGVLHFCGLGYSRSEEPRGQTSDHFIDLENLIFEPSFEHYVKDAFSPVGIMIDAWKSTYEAGSTLDVPIAVINDLYNEYDGTVTLKILDGETVVFSGSTLVSVPVNGRSVVNISVTIPENVSTYRLVAEIQLEDGEPVQSVREFTVLK
ncbi:sugar-binding domain-containing protein [Candidatus Latescibacterota bacterium]